MKKLSIGKMAIAISICLVLGGMRIQPVQAAAGGRTVGQSGRNTGDTSESVSAGGVSTRNVKDNGIGKVLKFNMDTSAFGKPASSKVIGASKEWTGTKVYFGEKVRTGSGGQAAPGVWRVLDPKTLLLHSEQRIGKEAPFEELVQTDGMEREGLIKGSFHEKERAAVKAFQIKETTSNAENITYKDKAVEQFQLFLLTAKDISDANYGFYSESTRLLSDNKGEWWTRSVNEITGFSVGIDEDGRLSEDSSKPGPAEYSYAPALYLDGSRVLFTTAADWKKHTAVAEILEHTGDDIWKMTLLGTNESLNAGLKSGQGETAQYLADSVITVTHGDAQKVLADSTQISALFTQQISGRETPVYYGKISDGTAGTVESDITLPADMKPGTYLLYIFAEDVNGENATDYASDLGTPLQITVLGKTNIEALPAAAAITFGQQLKEAALKGGKVVNVSGMEVPGTFSWKTPDTTPNASPAPREFEVIFTPNSPEYSAAEGKVLLQVNQAAQAPDMPGGLIETEFETKTVKETESLLPTGWKWLAADREKALEAGRTVQATAVYENHGGNYAVYTALLDIRRKECTHLKTEIRNKKDAVCTAAGYTGDTCCIDCGTVLAKGTEIPALSHSYTEQVTKEPAESEEGIKTFTCSRCGHQYTESIPATGSPSDQGHNHYYNGTRTLKWLGCEQQGEIEHYCGCGDAYVEVIPALGHDFKTEITKQATASSAGIRKYTCSRCGYSYTEEIPGLSGGNNGTGAGNGGNAGNSGAGGNGTGTAKGDAPHIRGNSRIKGWNDLNRHIAGAKEGETVQIDMEDSVILPAKTLKALKGRDLTLVLDIGGGMQWSIHGLDVTEEVSGDIDLGVTKNAGKIPSDMAAEIAGDRSALELSLAGEKPSGISAHLQIVLDEKKPGYYANLFVYNEETGELTYTDSPRMDGKGAAVLPVWEAGHYLVVPDTAVMDGSKEEEMPETVPEEKYPIETVPGDLSGREPAEEEIPVVVIIAVAAAVISLGVLGIAAFRVQTGKSRKALYEGDFPDPEE